MKTFGVIVASILGLAVLWGVLFALRVVLLPVHMANQALDTTYGVVDKTLNADNAIYNYEWFKQTFEDINALKNKVQISDNQIKQFVQDAGNRKDWTFEDKTEYSRLQSVKQGQMSMLEDVIATYNARSKMANRKIFENGILPSVFDLGANFLQ